jgi:hypothetical protein
MKTPVVVIGIGEMGGVFARGLLRIGHPVYPVTRGTDLAEVAVELPDPELVLVAVAENDLHTVLKQLPPAWHSGVALLQNELLPRDWEKKPGQDAKVLIPSPVYGPHADILQASLGAIGIPACVLKSKSELLFELVVKNVYIVTTNCAGLVTGGSVSELWSDHRELAEAVAREVISIQESLACCSFDADALITGMLAAFAGDPDHKCMGRSAPARLSRALQQAAAAGLAVPRLREIAARESG